MTDAEILTAIKNTPSLKQMAIDGKDVELANAPALAEASRKTYMLTSLGVLEIIGYTAGATAMTNLRALIGTNATARELVSGMDRYGWNIGDAQADNVLNALVPSVFTAGQITQILARANQSSPQSVERITRILAPFRPNGQTGGPIV